MKTWLPALACAVLLGCAPASAEQSATSLRNAYIAAVRSELPGVAIKVLDETTFEARLADGTVITAHTENLSRAIAADPDGESALIERFARSFI